MEEGCDRQSGGGDDSKVWASAAGEMELPSTKIVKALSKTVGWSSEFLRGQLILTSGYFSIDF